MMFFCLVGFATLQAVAEKLTSTQKRLGQLGIPRKSARFFLSLAQNNRLWHLWDFLEMDLAKMI